jgi:hypothetical protein
VVVTPINPEGIIAGAVAGADAIIGADAGAKAGADAGAIGANAGAIGAGAGVTEGSVAQIVVSLTQRKDIATRLSMKSIGTTELVALVRTVADDLKGSNSPDDQYKPISLWSTIYAPSAPRPPYCPLHSELMYLECCVPRLKYNPIRSASAGTRQPTFLGQSIDPNLCTAHHVKRCPG